MNVKIYDIDDKKYILMTELDDNGNHYLLLGNKDDDDDILFRKLDGEFLVPLDNEEEVARVLQLFDESN